MLFAGELEKADSTLLAVRAQRACTAGKLLFILFLICSPGQLSRMWRGRGCGCSGSQLGTSWHRVRNTITIKLCLALSHLHSPCSCQARLSARLSLYSQQPLNEPVHGVLNYTVLCMFVIPESQKTHQSWKGLAQPAGTQSSRRCTLLKHPNCFQHLNVSPKLLCRGRLSIPLFCASSRASYCTCSSLMGRCNPKN